MQKVDRRAPLPGLTALRFFAASYVFVFHLFPVHAEALAHPTILQRLIGAGFTGVSCFFVLSGFILAYTHPAVRDVPRFFRARFARIYPLYLFALLLAIPNFVITVRASGPRSQFWAIPADLLLLQNWFPSLSLAINTPAWTLSCEAFFYLLFPVLVGWSWLRTRRPVAGILVLWAVQLLPPLVMAFWIAPHYPAYVPLARMILFTPLLRVGEFIAGIVLGLAFLRRHSGSAAPPPASPAWHLWAAVLLCVACLCLNFTLPHEVVRNGLMLGPFSLLIWVLATTRSRFLSSRPLQLGGEISYGVYLLQSPFSHLLYSTLSRIPIGFLHHPLWILLIYPFAWLTYVTVEKPCRNLLMGKAATSPSKPIPTPQPELP